MSSLKGGWKIAKRNLKIIVTVIVILAVVFGCIKFFNIIKKTDNTDTVATSSETVEVSENEETISEEVENESEAETEAEAEKVAEELDLDELVNSDSYDDWVIVAQSEEATESHLLTIAQKCVDGKYAELAEQVAKNDACTATVMVKLSESDEESLLKVVANSSLSEEQALLKVAEKATNNHFTVVAELIVANDNCTSAVVRKLAESDELSIMMLVANSKISDEQALLKIANTAKNNSLSSLADAIRENENCTKSVKEVLGDL